MELSRIVNHFELGKVNSINRIGSGHINETYLVQTANDSRFILQKINTEVFKDPGILMSNLYHILNQLNDTDYPFRLFEIIPTTNGDPFLADESGTWRMISFIDGQEAVANKEDLRMSEIISRGYGNFLKSVNKMDPGLLQETIPDFHNPEVRFQQLMDAANSATQSRMEKSLSLLDHALAFSNITVEFQSIIESLPKRIIHGDAKDSNILLDPDGRVVGVIDLDTAMPGFIMNDFGDMVRSMCNTGKEDDPDYQDIKIDLLNFEGISNGFLKELNEILTQEELDSLLIGVRAILYEQFIRFLADYLNGDIYYSTSYPEHNLDRARVHLALLLDFQSNEDRFTQILNDCLSKL